MPLQLYSRFIGLPVAKALKSKPYKYSRQCYFLYPTKHFEHTNNTHRLYVALPCGLDDYVIQV